MSRPEPLPSLEAMRARTDIAVTDKWMVWGIASYIIWTLLAVGIVTRALQPAVSLGVFVGVLGSLGLIPSIGFSYLVFRLVDGQNNHSGREQAMFSEAINLSRSRTPKDDMRMVLPLNSAEQDLILAVSKSHERSGFLWALLTIVPYLGWIFLIVVLALLTEESTSHVRTEQPILEDLDRSLKGLGSLGLSLGAQRHISRNAGLFVSASILTLGVFTLIWTFLLIHDQETHFSYHATSEESLLQALSSAGVRSARAS